MLALSGLPAGCFAYKSRCGRVVLVVPVSGAVRCSPGVGQFLRGLGCSVCASAQASLSGEYVGCLVSCPAWVASALLSLPRPPARGSLSPHACLPW